MMTPPTPKEKSRSLFWLIWSTKLLKWSMSCAHRAGCGLPVSIAYAAVGTALFEDAGNRRVITYKTVLKMREEDAKISAKIQEVEAQS
jgi:hypothetical protein